LRYQSNDAQPGDSSTTSPSRASSRARDTASRIDAARTTGRTPANAASTSPDASPMATTARTWSASCVSGDIDKPLLRPPAMSTTDSNPRVAATTDAGVVAFESS